jgi:hypothetical protein
MAISVREACHSIGFHPRVLGVLLMIAGFGYVAGSFTSLLLPQYAQLVGQFAVVLNFGELPIIFWLLIWGARVPQSNGQASQLAVRYTTGCSWLSVTQASTAGERRS